MKDKTILTAESVTAGHPDKLCDTIADTVLDCCLEHDPDARVACEVLATAGKFVVAGEITALTIPDIPSIVRDTVRRPATTAGTLTWRSSSSLKAQTSQRQYNTGNRPQPVIRGSCMATPAAKRKTSCPCQWCWPTA